MRSLALLASVLFLAACCTAQEPQRNLTASIRWTWNSTFDSGSITFGSLLTSTIEKDVIFAFAGKVPWLPKSASYVVKLRASTGAELWLSPPLTVGPQNCLVFSETDEAVACVGGNTFAVLNRTSGHVIANGDYGVNRTIFSTNLGGSIIHNADPRTLVFILVSNNSQVNMSTEFVALDISSGRLDVLGNVTWHRALRAVWFLSSRRVAKTRAPHESRLEVSMLLWSAFEHTVGALACNVIGRYTVTSGEAAVRVDYTLPEAEANPNANAPNGGYCISPTISATTVGGATPHSIVSLTSYGSFIIRCYNSSTGKLIALTSIQDAVTPDYNGVGGMYVFRPDEDGFAMVISPSVSDGTLLGIAPQWNATLWTMKVPIIDGVTSDVSNNSITFGGITTDRVTRIDVRTGIVDFSTPVPSQDAMMSWIDYAGPYMLIFRPPQLTIVDGITGAMRGTTSLVAGALTGETSSDAFVYAPPVSTEHPFDLFVGGSNQVACLHFE